MELTTLHGDRRPFPSTPLEDHPVDASPRLLGALLVRAESDGTETVVRLVEVEAYRQDDAASHSFRGRTPRVEAMFDRPGTAYVYFTYGMHWCLNVTCEPAGTGSAVLLRAAVPVRGLTRIRARRPGVPDRDLLRGPARLTRALAVDREQYGVDLLDPGAPLRLEVDDWRAGGDAVRRGARVGVRHEADRPWRFWLDGVREVSRYSRHPRADRSGDTATSS